MTENVTFLPRQDGLLRRMIELLALTDKKGAGHGSLPGEPVSTSRGNEMRVNLFRKSRDRGLCATGILMASVALAVPSAGFAQDSAQIEELQQQIEELRQQLEQLREQQTETDRKAEQAATEAKKAGDTAEAFTTSGNDKVKLSISGQVDRGVLVTDDGENTDAFFVDNGNSSTRIRLIGEARPVDEVKVGTNIEVQFQSNSSTAVNQRDERNVGPNSFTERKLELYVDHARYGRLWLGQGDTASNGTSEVDLSGTSLIGYSSVSDMAGGILYRDNGELSTISVGDAFSNLDGLSRDDRIRYDTPSFAGFKLSGSLVADERADVALRYSREFGGTEVAAAAAFSRKPDDFDRVNGSASILLANGISVTAAAGTEDVDARDDDGMFYYGKLGYQSQFFSIGNTALGIDYQYGEDIGADGDETNSFGVFAVQNIDDLATEFYLGYRYYDLDRDNTDLDAINAVLTGARVKF